MVCLLTIAKVTSNKTLAMIVTAALYHPTSLVLVISILLLAALIIVTVSGILFLPFCYGKEWCGKPETFDTRKLIVTKPTIVTICEVYNTNVPWYQRKQIIWREKKPFKFSHWLDVTDPDVNLDYYLFLTVDFEINFADDETERAYHEHVKEMLEELPEYCRNADKVIKTIKKVGGKEQMFYQEQRMIMVIFFVTLPFAFVLLPLIYMMYRKGNFDKLCKRVTIKKLVSNANIELFL